ncbi:MAG: cytochrome c-type biogenesis CcmF C-terminal domain-containing protein [Dehalococcoidia bacterium]
MAELGNTSLIIALALASYSAFASFVGVRRQQQSLVLSGQRANYVTTLALSVAVAALVVAFLRNDFSIGYVAAHSNLAMAHIYTWVAFYAGNEGSLLFVAFALSGMAAVAMAMSPRRLGSQRPYANGVLMLILIFFLTVMLFMANPFEVLPVAPADGQGINPLLAHPGMFIHPPMIMVGLIAISVPFALGIGGLLSGRIDDDWVDTGRIWGLVAWVFLALGLLLGAWWAYTILGWGGYWAWDPVENAAFMPFLGLTAFIHSIMVQKRRGMFRMWNIALINISFSLGAFGIFINRGGPVPSVHSFGASTLGWVFLLFLAVVLVGSFGLFFYRFALLRSAQSLESMLSREAAFLVNNLLLLGVAFITLWGVVFPLISELTTGRIITVGEPFYNDVNGPLILALIVLMGVGPLVPWHHATWASVWRAISLPLFISLAVTALVALVLRITIPVVVLGIAASTLVATSIGQEWVRGTLARHRSSGAAYPVAFLQLLSSNRPRYGGYLVHLAIVMLAFGIIGSTFYNVEKDVFLTIGERSDVGDYTIEFAGVETTPYADRTERVASLRVYRGDEFVTTVEAWQGVFPAFNMLSTRAGIRSTPVEDLYIIFSEIQPDGQTAAFRLLVNPLVWWMWLAGPFVILGTVVALWPARQRAVAYVTTPDRRGPLPSGGLS